MNELNLVDVLAITREIALEAGVKAKHFWDNGFSQSTKSTAVDVVTEADKAVEALIVERLLAAFPDHHIFGEEGGGVGAPKETAAYRWYIDPIDGTTNFANHIPVFSVSMALTDADMNPIVGVVYNPIDGELYCATKGGGATLNGEPIHVSQKDSLITCVLASGFPYDRDPASTDNNMHEWAQFHLHTRGLRRMGSAALDCCYVACGRFDGYWEQKLMPYDVLAGLLCVTEAGGVVTDYHGNTPVGFVNDGRVCVSNGLIHAQMLDVLNGK
jgi:myo-inositol-1(or 4)-monophosphatase